MLDLTLLADDYAVCRLPADSAVPSGLLELANQGSVVSVTWTREEVSVICPAEHAPSVLATVLGPLADARVNIYACSTYDTDYLLVPAVRLSEAITALTTAGHRVSG
jgi:hypothetical protein